MKTFKEYLAEAMFGKSHITQCLSNIAHKLVTMGTADDEEMANKIYAFLTTHEATGYPKAELKSLQDDIVHFGKKWKHVQFGVGADELGKMIAKLDVCPTTEDSDDEGSDAVWDLHDDNMHALGLHEEADFDHGNDDYYDTHTFPPIEFVQKGSADLHQNKNNPRYGDNSLRDVTNEDLDVIQDTPTLDKLQEILNNAGVSDDEIIAGIGGIKPEAKQRVADALGVDVDHIDFLINELSMSLSKKDEDNYDLFTESYRQIMEEDERFGYEEDALGNITITDAQAGTSAFISGSEAQEILHQIFLNPGNTQEILAQYQTIMEEVKNWSAAGKNDISMSMSKNVVASPKKPPFEKTRKIVKKKAKPLTEAEDDFHEEIHANDGTYNFVWKTGDKHGTGTASFTMKYNVPIFHIVSVRDANGNEVDDYDHADILDQAKKYIPEV